MKFLNKQFTQETLKLALPVMLTQVGQVSVNLFDNIIVGKLLGAKALAAVSLGNAMFFSIFNSVHNNIQNISGIFCYT